MLSEVAVAHNLSHEKTTLTTNFNKKQIHLEKNPLWTRQGYSLNNMSLGWGQM